MAQQVFGDRIGPAGRHIVTFDGVHEFDNDIGPALRWVFRIADGEPHAGCTFSVVTGRELLGGTAYGDLMDALYGRRLQQGDVVDPIGDHLGKRFELVARPGRASGGVFHSVSVVKES